MQGPPLHSLALKVSKIHTDILGYSSTDFHSKVFNFLQGKIRFFLLFRREWIPWLTYWQKGSLHAELLPGSLELFGMPLWTTQFVSLDRENYRAKASPFSLLGGAGFTAQAPDTMQMVP